MTPVQAFTYSGPRAAFECSSGPRDAKIALVGEAFGEQEDLVKRPFIGQSGQELRRMLKEADIDPAQCFMTNVFAFRPPSNNIDLLCGSRSDVGKDYAFPAIKAGKYIRPEFLAELPRLIEELEAVQPNLIVALGNVACWALLGSSGIGKIRGTITPSQGDWTGNAIKVLPTYHPSAVLRLWSYRPIVIADFMKAKREALFPEIRRPQRWVLVNPTLREIDEWTERYAITAPRLSIDIETARKQISMIGFANSPSNAIVIPFFNRKFENYWPTLHDELCARRGVQRLLLLACEKLFQNGLYDMQYLLREGFKLRNVLQDAMLLHHSLFPELQKGLGFMGSIYTSEPAWKLMRGKSEELKADE